MTVVIDASAMLRTAQVQQELPPGDPARTLLAHLAGRFGLQAPALYAWELGNVVHSKHPDRFGASPEERARLLDAMIRVVELDQPDRTAINAAARIVEDEGVTFYDAAYLELAQRTEGFLLTEDERLLESARAVLGVDYGLDLAGALAHVQDGVL